MSKDCTGVNDPTSNSWSACNGQDTPAYRDSDYVRNVLAAKGGMQSPNSYRSMQALRAAMSSPTSYPTNNLATRATAVQTPRDIQVSPSQVSYDQRSTNRRLTTQEITGLSYDSVSGSRPAGSFFTLSNAYSSR